MNIPTPAMPTAEPVFRASGEAKQFRQLDFTSAPS